MKNGYLILFLVALVSSAHGYTVYRDVKAYGAKGDGTTDDTGAIIRALTEGRGDNANAPYGSTTYSSNTQRPAYVYFPPGTYLVTNTLPVVYYTQMIGDSKNVPTIKFVHGGNDIRVLEVAGNWYHGANQDNFYRQIHNFNIDMTGCTQCTGVHWQVAQATSLRNLYFKSGTNTKNQGLWMENGSGGFMADIVFEGGTYGMWVGNQQFTSRNVTVRGASQAGIYMNWNWIWTLKSLQIENCPVGVDVASGTGSIVLLDSTFTNVPIGVRTTGKPGSGINTVVIDNLKVSNVPVVVRDSTGTILTASGVVKSWVSGHVWKSGTNTVTHADLSSQSPNKPGVLTPDGSSFFEMAKPDLEAEANVVDVSTLGVVGDNVTDITAKLQSALNANTGKVLLFPHGIYIISDTVVIPPNTKLVGQAWSALAASGSKFRDANNPIPMLQVGKAGQTGGCQMVNFIITTQGPQPGCKLIEWNLHDPSGQPGANGMWDVHYRIGGAEGTNIRPNNCPKGDGSGAPASSCTGAWALLHATASSSIYMENVWGWVADHDIDRADQLNVYSTRGFLCESQGPVWMYGTAMEHSVLYQYNFNNAKNVIMGAIQTEAPYYQPSTNTPFPVKAHPTDPTFCNNAANCKMAYGLNVESSSDIYLYSAGLYSFFDTWDQTCLKGDNPNCQRNMVNIRNSKQIYQYALSTYGSVYMQTDNETYSLASANANTFCSTVAVDLNLF